MKTYYRRDDVLEALANGELVKTDEVSARVLRQRVWICGAGSPGCLYDNGPNYHRTRREALDDLINCADGYGTANGDDAPPRGFISELRRYGRAMSRGWVYEVSSGTIGSIL